MGGVSGIGLAPVVLLHGARTSRTMWRAQTEALARTGRAALAIDLPGHGRRIGEPFTVEASMEAVDDAVGALGGRAVVLGLSLGGYLAIAYAARRPGRVCGLVAAGCSSVPDQPLTTTWALASRLIARLPDRGARLNQALVDRALPLDGARAAGEGGFALDVMVEMLAAIRTVRPLEDLARVTCPVWIVNGQWDHFRLQERSYLRACPTARLVTVRGATHLVSLVRPVAFTRVLLQTLDVVDAREARTGAQPGAVPDPWNSDQARTPPTMPAELGTTTTSSPSSSRTAGRMCLALPPPR